MFWLGLIVGMVVAVIALVVWLTVNIKKYFNTTEEYWNVIDVVYDATQNRESQLQLLKDGEIINEVTLEEA